MKKFNILIVDDELHAVQGILAGINWHLLEIDSIHTAHSFAQAKKVFQSEKIDLLLSDIDMPHGNGIDLLSWVRENCLKVEAIFLTSHSNFNYAQEAIRLKSLNYLLKPIDFKALEQEIQHAIVKMKSDIEVHQVETSYKHMEEMHQNHLREEFWLALINKNIANTREEIDKLLKKFKLKYDNEIEFTGVLIHVQQDSNEKIENEGASLYFLRSAVIENIVNYNKNVTVVNLASNYMIVIIPSTCRLSEEQLVTNCKTFIKKCNQQFHYDLNCYIGSSAVMENVVNIIDELRKVDRNNVNFVNKVTTLGENELPLDYISDIPREDWILLIRSGSKDELLTEINQVFSSWNNENLSITWQTLRSFYRDLLQIIFYTLQRKGLEASRVFSKELFERPEKVLTTVKSLEQWTYLVVDVVMDQINHRDNGQTVVDKVKQYIKENIHKYRLTREDIANHVYFNPDYLARIFKQETGISISEYMIAQRMELAKRLLIRTNLSISDISLECGYSNFSYFSTLFRKMNDYSPNDYRKKHQK